ncbi:MAG: response regulator transcription factor [Gammaproteobacteria bacterium]|nr:response regulator transcription factor [Gammaproteobacteria bacterium]
MSALENTVYIVDDDPSVRHSLTWLIESVGQCVKTYESPTVFLQEYREGGPGCLILDVRMPEISGLDLQEQLIKSGFTLPIIIITGHADVPMAIRALKAGAFDFIEKPFNDQLLIERIQQAIEHCQNLSKKNQLRQKVNERLSKLTAREKQVLEGVVSGKSNKIIAKELDISIKTIEVHRANLMAKMDASSLSDLIRKSLLAD